MAPSDEAAPITLLIVDDYEPIGTLLDRLLSRYDDIRIVGVARSGEEAIETALRTTPAVVIMDAHMPGIGGVEATARLLKALPQTRVLGYSAHEDEAAMRAAGAVDFIWKGTAPDRLLSAIRAGRS